VMRYSYYPSLGSTTGGCTTLPCGGDTWSAIPESSEEVIDILLEFLLEISWN
jgi:hypothetical protein